jgi:uncharacterized membrane protein
MEVIPWDKLRHQLQINARNGPYAFSCIKQMTCFVVKTLTRCLTTHRKGKFNLHLEHIHLILVVYLGV